MGTAMFVMGVVGWLVAAWMRMATERKLAAAKMLPPIDTDEDLINVLETSDAPVAGKLLKAASEVEEDWKHNLGARMDCKKQWEIFCEDIALESDDQGRLGVVREWVNRKEVFTYYEKLQISKMFESAEVRAAARAELSRGD